MEKYLSLIDNTTHRIAVSQLRLSSHTLNIETLRGTISDPNERTCNLCNLKKREDEIHFITECSHYTPLRDTLKE